MKLHNHPSSPRLHPVSPAGKTWLLALALCGGLHGASHGQGLFFADNGSAAYDTTLGGTPNTTHDLNLELLLGTASAAVNTPVVTLLLSSGATRTSSSQFGQTLAAAGDISNFGLIYDGTGQSYTLAGYTASSTIYLQVAAWAGNYASYSAAVGANAYAGESSIFTETVPSSQAGSVNINNFGVINLVQAVPSVVPEPPALALAGLGLATLAVLRRRRPAPGGVSA